jgi:hypothetical protein
MSLLRDQLIEWNHKFPLDRWWRVKYNIPLYSPQHLDSNQLDITLDYLEDQIFKELKLEKAKKTVDFDIEIPTGSLLKKQITTNDEALFDNMDISNFKALETNE